MADGESLFRERAERARWARWAERAEARGDFDGTEDPTELLRGDEPGVCASCGRESSTDFCWRCQREDETGRRW